MNRLIALCLAAWFCPALYAADFRGAKLVGIEGTKSFKRTAGDLTNHVELTSSEIDPGMPWTELIVSWNVQMPTNSGLKVEVRALHGDKPTAWYTMAYWSPPGSPHKRESVTGQKDNCGEVLTDTLRLFQAAGKAQLRLTLAASEGGTPKVDFMSLCFADTRQNFPALPPNKKAWGKTLPVPERTQMVYPNGGVLCSPTTVSMLLGYWSRRLDRPQVDADVPEIVTAVYDSNWQGTGNWAFNTAYAGSREGLRAYVSRFTDVSELEDWVTKGFPVGISVCYDRLRGKEGGPNGHLIVCVGFTEEGDVIVNDPGTRLNVRKTFPRENLVRAWAVSKNTVYLVHPERARLPGDRFGHWAD